MSQVMSFGGVTGLVVHRSDAVYNRHSKKWEVTEPGQYRDFEHMRQHTKSYNSYSEYITEKYGRKS